MMSDEKAGVWRTAYGGVVLLRRDATKYVWRRFEQLCPLAVHVSLISGCFCGGTLRGIIRVYLVPQGFHGVPL
jgi:hypothetical protein